MLILLRDTFCCWVLGRTVTGFSREESHDSFIEHVRMLSGRSYTSAEYMNVIAEGRKQVERC